MIAPLAAFYQTQACGFVNDVHIAPVKAIHGGTILAAILMAAAACAFEIVHPERLVRVILAMSVTEEFLAVIDFTPQSVEIIARAGSLLPVGCLDSPQRLDFRAARGLAGAYHTAVFVRGEVRGCRENAESVCHAACFLLPFPSSIPQCPIPICYTCCRESISASIWRRWRDW
jgi:hypothetical protein